MFQHHSFYYVVPRQSIPSPPLTTYSIVDPTEPTTRSEETNGLVKEAHNGKE